MMNLGNAQQLSLIKSGKQFLQSMDYPWIRLLCFRLFSILDTGFLFAGSMFLYRRFPDRILLAVFRSALSKCRMCL